MTRIKPIEYHGCKWTLFPEINKALPEKPIYVEAFGGSGTVLVNRDPVEIEVFNDLDSRLVNFFRILRDYPEELIERLEMTPYSRQEYEISHEIHDDPVEDARRFFVFTCQSRSQRATDYNPTSWARDVTPKEVRNRHVVSYRNRIERLYEVAERFKNVQIENKDAIELIGDYDDDRVAMYLDPPYLHETRVSVDNYDTEMSHKDHVNLLETVKDNNASIVISGYDSYLYNSHLSDWERKCYDDEVLWVKYAD